MTKEFEKLLNLKDTEGELTFDECQAINKYLSKVNIKDIPEEQRDNVKKYLVSSLNMNSVEAEIIGPIENLLINLGR